MWWYAGRRETIKMKLEEYTLKNGQTRYLIKGYVGTDPITGNEFHTSRRGFKTKREAKLAEKRLIIEFEENGSPIKHNMMTFQEVVELWLPIYETTVKESTFQTQFDVIRLHIAPRFGSISVDKINTVYCQEQVNDWYQNYVKYSNLIGLTQRILEYARLNLKLIKENPMKDVIRPMRKRKPNEKKFESSYFSKSELDHFMQCVEALNDPQTSILFRIIAYTGVREGEACGLRWSDFDEVNKALMIRRTVARGKNYQKNIQATKSQAGERTISLDDETVKQLKTWRNMQRELMLMFGFNTDSPDQYIITNEKNEYQYAQYPYARLKALRRKFDFGHITVHGLRHTHCTLLFEAGADLKEVQDRMGHESTDMVQEIYRHVNKEKKSELGNKFADFMTSKSKPGQNLVKQKKSTLS